MSRPIPEVHTTRLATSLGSINNTYGIWGSNKFYMNDFPFFDVITLAQYLDISPRELEIFKSLPSQTYYSKFYIDKQTGKIVPNDAGLNLREINAPCQWLKNIQLKLLEFFMLFKKHKCNFAFMKGKNIVDAAKNVSQGELLIHIDLKDFFPSHTMLYIRKNLEAILKDQFNVELANSVLVSIVNLVCYKGKLPQGSPCSPILSIILNYNFDCRVSDLAEKYNLVYSRYADDLCFSGNISDTTARLFLDELFEVVHPFRVNYKKVGFMRDRAYPIFTGVQMRFPKTTYIPATQSSKFSQIFRKVFELPEATMTVSAKNIVFKIPASTPQEYQCQEVWKDRIEIFANLLATKYPQIKFMIKPSFLYIQSVKTVLGLHIADNEIKYPRKKYNELRLLAMLMGIQRGYKSTTFKFRDTPIINNVVHQLAKTSSKSLMNPRYRNLLVKPLNRKSFMGKLSFIKMVDEEKANKLREVEEKYFKRTLQSIVLRLTEMKEEQHANRVSEKL